MGSKGGGGRRGAGGGGAAAEEKTPEWAAQAEVERQFGVTFKPSRGSGLTTVLVDVEKVDASLATDPAFHVGPGGTGAAIPGRYAGVGSFLETARTQKIPVEQTRLHVGSDGRAGISDGRHRFAYFRDHGAKTLPVSVDFRSARKIKRLFGAE